MRITEITDQPNAATIAKMLLRDCTPFLSAIDYDIKTYPLLRGVKIVPTSIVAVTTNKQRKPVDMPGVVSNAIDDYFQETTGIRWRSSSVFASGNSNAALYYGRIFYVFPIGDFHYCWSPYVSDLFLGLEKALIKHGLRDGYSVFKSFSEEEESDVEKRKLALKTLHDDIMPYFEYRADSGLQEAIYSAHAEIMISCDKYYLVSIDMAQAAAEIIQGM